ncbi:hypothetical protein CERSUDRAFT_96356 [Gelatoporia subvermispora B]|uniref:Uncharacterized protein n=1 Tax=Ceriporiopsis subvermispora (strain B) TaxID=914234 RepID=M2RBG5_CERS8|nr:hypothetical protein CERSUDRAFT_96356 [Gelatoporia subvermispora B]
MEMEEGRRLPNDGDAAVRVLTCPGTTIHYDTVTHPPSSAFSSAPFYLRPIVPFFHQIPLAAPLLTHIPSHTSRPTPALNFCYCTPHSDLTFPNRAAAARPALPPACTRARPRLHEEQATRPSAKNTTQHPVAPLSPHAHERAHVRQSPAPPALAAPPLAHASSVSGTNAQRPSTPGHPRLAPHLAPHLAPRLMHDAQCPAACARDPGSPSRRCAHAQGPEHGTSSRVPGPVSHLDRPCDDDASRPLDGSSSRGTRPIQSTQREVGHSVPRTPAVGTQLARAG